uniref:zinc finger protein 596-like isoform X2 n=1 Tax=Styela clava TaxID=7725 RepID=UPI0019392961|nr:zinc finger protein 596-like isoform X2 [Styela clava]
MRETAKVSFGEVAGSVCREFDKFLEVFDGDVLSLLNFLIKRNDLSESILLTEDTQELTVETPKQNIGDIHDLIDSFVEQNRLKSRSDAIEVLVLSSGMVWKDANEMVLKSRHRTGIINKLSQDRIENKFCDLQVVIGNHDTYWVHKCVLVASSEYFSNIMKSDTRRITIFNMPKPESFTMILDFIYTGEILLSKEHCPAILKISKYLKMEALQKTCEDFLKLVPQRCKSKETSTDEIVVVQNQTYSNQRTDYLQDSFTKPRCEHCSEVFSDHKSLELHLKTAHDSVNAVVTVIGSQSEHLQIEKKEKKLVARGMPFSCHLCKSLFRSRSHLKRHMLSHSGERKHCCTTCGKLFLKADHLTRHERTHSTERPFQCDQCDKKFKTKDNLKRHQLTHSNERPFFCELCAKQFKDKGGLLIHQKSHSKSEPICPHCGKRFKQQNRLAYHIIRHNNPLTCKICGKTFAFQNHLRRHTMMHTGDRPFSCETCGRQFVNVHGLKLHQKKHTGIGLHGCEMCDRKFLDKFHLKRHMKTHTGEKPFKCEICDRSFSRADNCESHKRTCMVKLAIQKDIQSFTEQDGGQLRVKRIRQQGDETSFVEQVGNEVLPEGQQTIENIAIAVSASEMMNCRYKRINKRLPELKLVLLDDKEQEDSGSEDLANISISDDTAPNMGYQPAIDLESITQGKESTFEDVSKISHQHSSTCQWTDDFSADASEV